VINEITKNNFPFRLHYQILLDFELENIETIQICTLLEFKRDSNLSGKI
jgi:hypothetical protein